MFMKNLFLIIIGSLIITSCKKDDNENIQPQEKLTNQLIGTWKASYIYPINSTCSNQTDETLILNSNFSASSQYSEVNSQGSCTATNSTKAGNITVSTPTQSEINILNNNIRIIEVFGQEYPDFDDITSLDYNINLKNQKYYIKIKNDTEFYRYHQQGEGNYTRKILYKKQ